jgi:hypothetical protein
LRYFGWRDDSIGVPKGPVSGRGEDNLVAITLHAGCYQ